LHELAEALRGGVTFVRDMAGDARLLADLQRVSLNGELAAPNIGYSALMAGPGFFSDPRNDLACRGKIPGQTPWNKAVTQETDLVRAVAEAHRQALLVWSHAALSPSKPGDAVDAGVDVISHADLLVWEAMPQVDPGTNGLARRWLGEDLRAVPPDHPAIVSLLRRMKEKGTILDATVYIYRIMQRMAQEKQPQFKPIADQRARFAYAVTRLAHEMGVAVCAGTDGMRERDDAPLPALHKELETLVSECGFTPAAALRAATLDSARALGIGATRGTIEPGKIADLVILRADPTLDIANCGAIEQVIKSGKRVPR
jgi:imidazolonepropionase-like amidohydrolase